MSTMTVPTTLDVSGTPRVPLSRLVKVELRKMVDTRAGLWLLIAIGLITGLATVIFGLAGHDEDKTFGAFLGFAGVPQGFLLPVLGILLVTQEWGQRTAMVTFTLEPHRRRVLNAKVIAALVLALAALVVAFAFASLATVVFGGTDAWRDFHAADPAKFGLLQGLGTLQGLSYGLLLLNSAFAIVLFFILPQVITLIANIWPLISDKAEWIDFGTAQGVIFDDNATAKGWAQLAVTAFVWVIIPFAIGLWRVLRTEVK